MGFSRQEYWSGLPFPSPGVLPDPGIKLGSPAFLKNLPAMQDTQFQSLGWEDPLEKGMAIHSNILAWRSPWTDEPGELQSIESQRTERD